MIPISSRFRYIRPGWLIHLPPFLLYLLYLIFFEFIMMADIMYRSLSYCDPHLPAPHSAEDEDWVLSRLRWSRHTEYRDHVMISHALPRSIVRLYTSRAALLPGYVPREYREVLKDSRILRYLALPYEIMLDALFELYDQSFACGYQNRIFRMLCILQAESRGTLKALLDDVVVAVITRHQSRSLRR